MEQKEQPASLSLRRVTESDVRLLYEWRNEAGTRKASFHQEPIAYEDHKTWFAAARRNPDISMWILEENGRPAGQVRTAKQNGVYSISYSIDRDLRGHGYGKRMLALLEQELRREKEEHPDAGTPEEIVLSGEVRKENAASRAVFRSLGYEESETAEGFLYRKTLSSTWLVSIIMTTFNSSLHIRETLDSVLSQDYPSIEIVVADGGSTDGTVGVLREYAEKHPSIRWQSEPDQGIYDGMNRAIRRARGDIIAVMNDLFTTPHAVSTMVKAILDAEKGAAPQAPNGARERIIGAHADLAYMDGDRVVRRWRMGEGTIEDGWLPAHPTMYLKREVYEEYGLYDLRYHSSSDYEFMVRVLRHPENHLVYVPEEIIHMFYGGTSNAGVRGYLRNTREAWQALRADGIPHPARVIARRIRRTLRQFR